jgi:hypothetical protein
MKRTCRTSLHASPPLRLIVTCDRGPLSVAPPGVQRRFHPEHPHPHPSNDAGGATRVSTSLSCCCLLVPTCKGIMRHNEVCHHSTRQQNVSHDSADPLPAHPPFHNVEYGMPVADGGHQCNNAPRLCWLPCELAGVAAFAVLVPRPWALAGPMKKLGVCLQGLALQHHTGRRGALGFTRSLGYLRLQ